MSDYSQKKAGNYLIVKKIGDGGFATVYLAQHVILEKKAAVKFLLEDWVEEADVVARFFDEARTMERLKDHPNIVRILDIATVDKCSEEGLPPYFVMEYVEGRTLEDCMHQELGFQLEEVVEIARCSLLALQHCHSFEVVHRDVKPSNIMITKDGEVKLTDFGIAKAYKNTSKTSEGLTLGSTDYMSPEQSLGKKDLDLRSDIYSLGVTLYQMVCDRLPFLGDSPNEVALKHIQQDPTPACQVNDAIPMRLNDVIMKAMAKDRNDRFQTCNEMMEAIKLVLEPDEPVSIEFDELDLSDSGMDEEGGACSIADIDDSMGTTTQRFVSSPPASLVYGLRVFIVIALFTILFLGVFKGYYALTQATISLQATPAGSLVLLNGELVGSSPVSLDLPPMGYLINIYKDGYATHSLYISANSRQEYNVSPKLLLLDPPKIEHFKSVLENHRRLVSKSRVSDSIDKSWKNIFDLLQANIGYDEYNLLFIDLCRNTDCLDKALAFYSKLNNTSPSAQSFAFAGLIKAHQGQANDSLDLYMQAWLRDPNYKFLLNMLADHFIRENRLDRAREYLQMSVFLYPEQQNIKDKLNSLN